MLDLVERMRAIAFNGRVDTLNAKGDLLVEAADEIERLRDALVRIQDLTQHNMGMSARDETCVHREASKALSPKEEPDA